MNSVTLTNEEARSFLLWREHQEVFEHLIKANVFKVKGGRATLNFNFEGILTSIDIDFQAYKRSKIVVVE